MLQLFRLLTVLALLAFAINAIVIVVMFAILAGLIFRTKQTLSLLLFFGALAAFAANPAIGLALASVVGVISYIPKIMQRKGKIYSYQGGFY